MQYSWANHKNNKSLLLFFTGWGLNENHTSHLNSGNYDVLVCYDYKNIDDEILPLLKNYENIIVVGYSMGVWAASYFMQTYTITPTKKIAINGTLQPVSDLYGIPENIYEATSNTLNEANLLKFQLRICGNKTAYQRLCEMPVKSSIPELQKELIAIRHNQSTAEPFQPWDLAILCTLDKIFPFENMKNYWTKSETPIQTIDTAHFPFYNWNSWNEILNN